MTLHSYKVFRYGRNGRLMSLALIFLLRAFQIVSVCIYCDGCWLSGIMIIHAQKTFENVGDVTELGGDDLGR